MTDTTKIKNLYDVLDKLESAQWCLDKEDGNKTIKENLQYLIDDTQQAIRQEEENIK